MEHKNTHNAEDEIDLLALFKTIWQGKKTIIRFLIIFGCIGLFIAVFSAKEYTASVTLVPQTGGSKISGNLGGLAAMAGINLGGGNEEGIPPALYPKIAQSIPFQKELLSVSLKFSHVKKEITYKEYYEKYKKRNVLSFLRSFTIGLPKKMLSFFKRKNINRVEVSNDAIFRVSEIENALFKQLQEQLLMENNSKDGFVTISFSMPEALPAAQMVKKIQELLQKMIINFKIQKTKDEFNFIEGRYKELKKDFEEKQKKLASFRDRNQGLSTSRSRSHLESLQSEYNLAYSIYSELAKQLETQKIKLKENTPVFTVIEPVSIPIDKSKPKRGLIILVCLFLGLFFGSIFVLGKKWFNDLKKIIIK